jgi:hypothetical protein
MNWLTVLKLLLTLAVWAARKADERAIARNITHELEIAQGVRVREALRVRSRILDGSVPADDADPHRRD